LTVSRRQFLAMSGVAVLPLLSLPVQASPAAQPHQIGEIWGMPFMARGAQSAAFKRRKRRVTVGSGWDIGIS
jgi:hypothetical protein